MLSLRKCIPICFVGVFLALSLLWFVRADISLALWHATHRFPDVAYFYNPTTETALEIARYHFDLKNVDENAYDIETAERFYLKAIALDPKTPLAWYQLGRIAFLRGEFGKALYRLDREFEITGEEFPSTHYTRGLVYGFIGERGLAVDDFLSYLKTDPRGWYTYNDMAWLYFEAGEFQTVALLAERGLEYNPENPWLLMTLGVAKMNLGERERARELLARAGFAAQELTEEDWARAYPGNDPRVVPLGLQEFRDAVTSNLQLVHK